MNWLAILFPTYWLARPKVGVTVLLVGGAAYLLFTLYWSDADGERVGKLASLDRTGWFCKTYEGELLIGTGTGSAPLPWRFTVSSETVAQQLISRKGKNVRVHYREYRRIPVSCFGDTAYFVDRVASSG